MTRLSFCTSTNGRFRVLDGQIMRTAIRIPSALVPLTDGNRLKKFVHYTTRLARNEYKPILCFLGSDAFQL
jgi:hypothetical protein